MLPDAVCAYIFPVQVITLIRQTLWPDAMQGVLRRAAPQLWQDKKFRFFPEETLGSKIGVFVEWTWGIFFGGITYLRFTHSHNNESDINEAKR